jgi:hypothetical protein
LKEKEDTENFQNKKEDFSKKLEGNVKSFLLKKLAMKK